MNTTSIFAILFGICLMLNLVQYEYSRSLHTEVSAYQAQIEQLKIASEKQSEDARMAYQSALEDTAQLRGKAQAILRDHVPNNCSKSIKWMIQQAGAL